MPGSRVGRRIVALLAWLAALPTGRPAAAHDIPNARIERGTQVILAPGEVRVDYEVTLAELTLAQDLRHLDGEAIVGDRAALFERYARVVGPLNARGFLVQVDGQDVDLRPVDFTIAVEDHPRFRFRFAAEIPACGRLVLADTNYASSEGTTRLALAAEAGVALTGDLPPDRLESIPVRASWQLTDAEERRARRLDVTYRPGPAPPPRVGARDHAAPAPPIPPAAGPAANLAAGAGLTRLLDLRAADSTTGWAVLAFFLGMVHAIQPGHGKTLMAAATLGGTSASPARGAWLGVVTAVGHLIGVVALAGLLWASATTRYGPIHAIIARGAGFVIAAVGAFRVGRHMAGHAPGHGHPAGPRAGAWSLGLAAGVVPCWDAVALVVLAEATGQLPRGLVLLAAFSAGLAVVLVGVGWVAGRLGRRATSFRASLAARWLGLASGLVLATIGLGLLRS